MTTPTTQRKADERAQKALAAITERLALTYRIRLALTYRICCGTSPKQSVGELLDVTIKMPEWEIVRAAIDQSTRQAAPSGQWTIEKQDDMGIVRDAAGARITSTYYSDAKRFVDAHNASVVRAATDQPSAGQVDERAAFEAWAKSKGHDVVSRLETSGKFYVSSFTRHAWEIWQAARASLTPTAPQAASQQADEAADAFCDANCTWTDHHPECKFAAPQAATTATCQPSELTGQPDATICQLAAATASASQVDPSMALPHRTAAEWGVPFGVLPPEYKAEQAAKNARARAALEQLAVDESEGGHHD